MSQSAPKPRVLLLIPNLDFGGAQRSFSKISFGLEARFEVYVAVFNTDAGVAYPHGGKLLDMGVGGGANPLSKLLRLRERIERLRAIKQEYGFVAFVSFLEGADYVNVFSKSTRGERTYTSVRGSKLFDPEITGLVGKLRIHAGIPLTYRLADRIITVSEGLKEEVEGPPFNVRPEKVRVITNFYDTAAIRRQAQEPLDPDYAAVFRHPVIINSSRLHQQKNLPGLLAVFAEVARRYPPARLVIIGDGGLKEDLLTLARTTLGLRTHDVWSGAPVDDSSQVYFVGFQQNPFRFLARAQVFAFPSVYEGFPNSLAEAMICGVASISTDCSTGPREIMAPGSGSPQQVQQAAEYAPAGILLPLLNRPDPAPAVAEWARVLSELIADPTACADLGARAAARMEDYSPARVFGRWEELLLESR